MADPPNNSLIGVLEQFMADGQQPIGTVFPPRSDAPGLPDMGAREVALRRFCDFLSLLPFMRTMRGAPQPFLVPRKQIHINQPDSVVGASGGVKLPTIAFLTSSADETDSGWLGPADIIDGTEDLYAPDTALFYLGWHTENLVLEVVAAKPATRRSIVEGIKQVLRSADGSSSLSLSLPDYFDQDATFTLVSSEYVEDQDAVRNRRRGHLTILLSMPEVMLANALTLHPYVTVHTVDTGPLSIGVEVSDPP